MLCALVLPASAQAGSDVIWNGTLGTNGIFGPRHSLTSVWATYYGGSAACVNALNADGSGWAGSSFCASPSNTNVGHPYCACKLRYGYGYANSNYSTGYWRQFW